MAAHNLSLKVLQAFDNGKSFNKLKTGIRLAKLTL
jgi:hypothetical protein